MPQLRRIFWGRHRGRGTYTFHSRYIHRQSVVVVTASEGDDATTTDSPHRFVGEASIRIENIAPFDRRVEFVVVVDWDEPLPLWTDIVIHDGYPTFIR